MTTHQADVGLLEDLFGLSGEVAVITGAGAGLGKEIASLLAGAGATVVIADVRLDAAQSAADELGERAVAMSVDVTDEASVVALFDRVDNELDGASILVNNAGIYPNRMLVDMSVEDWDLVQSINLRGPFLCSREAVKGMRARGRGGRIVNISSIAALHPALMGNTHYTSSKAGLIMLTKTLALEVAADRILVNAVLPGGMATETREARVADAATWAGPATGPGRFLLGVAPPIKHASAVLYLASPAGGHITGQTLVVDGGFMIS